jgi:NADPH-dependent 2,4-dienoyl-CoA reductase/sulfur reductase-like enzyme
MPPFDPEMVQPAHEILKAKGVELCLGDGVAGFEQKVRGLGLRVWGLGFW